MDELNKKSKNFYSLLNGVDEFIEFSEFDKPLHKNVCADFAALKQKAASEGFDLKLASAYRNIAQQIVIWNEKAQGLRPVLDDEEKPLDLKRMTNKEKVFSILRWSALPGASRHHWGSDFDVYEANGIEKGYRLKLTVSETQKGGPFFMFYEWLKEYLLEDTCPFFRPYEIDRGGVAPEPWHLSHKVCAKMFETHLNISALKECVESMDIALKDEVLDSFEEIYARFVSVN